MLTLLRFILKLFWKVIAISLTVYLGLVLMLVSTLFLQQHYETQYKSVLIKPLVTAQNFEQWDVQTREYLNKLPKKTWKDDLQMRLTYPGLHSRYLQVDYEITQLKEEMLQLSSSLKIEFAKNPLLKKTWEVMVLKQQGEKEMQWSEITTGIKSFLKEPQYQSQLLKDYSSHTRRVALLGQNIMRLNYSLRGELKDILPINIMDAW